MKKEKLVLVQVLVTEPLDRWIRQSAKRAKTPVSRWIRQLLQAKRMELPALATEETPERRTR